MRLLPALLGVAFGSVHLFSTLPEPATTHPGVFAVAQDAAPARDAAFAPSQVPEDLDVDVESSRVTLRVGQSVLDVVPFFELDSVSQSGLWTLLDYSRDRLISTEVVPFGPNLHRIRRTTVMTQADVTIRREGTRVTINAVTSLKRDLSVHLASAVRIGWPGSVKVEEHLWLAASRSPSAPIEFLAFRQGRLELLRADHDEKGPFETLAAWPPHDPWFTLGPFRCRVEGWSVQGSRAASPTAGWGVSQAAVEAVGTWLVFELAATSVGRGFDTVVLAAGTYELTLDIVVNPPS
jgi:hypothetical protein